MRVDTAKPYTHPVPFSRPAGRRRIEVFSPKMDRRLSLRSYDIYRTWLVIEANPAIPRFCERPTFVDQPGGAVVDFWVQLGREAAGEFWIVERAPTHEGEAATASPDRSDQLHGLPVRYLNRNDLLGWDTPITNWSKIVPYLVSHRQYRDELLEQSILSYLDQFETLAAVLDRFRKRDATTVEAALFVLLAQGSVISPDLVTEPLSNQTRFCRSSSVMAQVNP